MSDYKLEVAEAHGRNLAPFSDEETARRALFQRRDDSLALLKEASRSTRTFDPDFTPDSLKHLEAWYFDLWESQAFCTVGLGRSEFETAMAMYFGEVLVRNDAGFRWIVEEYALEPGKYELGVRKESLNVMLDRYTDLFARADNKKRQSVWRSFIKYTR